MNTPDQLETWSARRAAIVAHWRASKSLTATGKAFGLSRQRVFQIVNMKEGNGQDGQDQPGGSDPAPATGTEQRG